MPRKTRTEAGKLAYDRINKREAAVLSDSAVQCATYTYDFDKDAGAVGDVEFLVTLPATS